MAYRLDGARAVGDGDVSGGQDGVRDLGVGEDGGLSAVRHEGVDDLGGNHAGLEHLVFRLLLLLLLLGGGGPVDGGDCSGGREDGEDGLGMHIQELCLLSVAMRCMYCCCCMVFGDGC